MPARHLGFPRGSAASVQGLLFPLDFLLPFRIRPVVAQRQFARLALREVEVHDALDIDGESLRSQWDDRTGEAVGEGSSAGAIRPSPGLEKRRKSRASTRTGSSDERDERVVRSSRAGKVPAAQTGHFTKTKPPAPFTFSGSTNSVGPDLGNDMPKLAKGRRSQSMTTKKLMVTSQEKRKQHAPASDQPVSPGQVTEAAAPDLSSPTTRPRTLSERLFGRRISSPSLNTTDPQAASLTVTSSTSTNTTPIAPTGPRSFTHKHLSRRDREPPSPSAIFDHLSDRQSLVTPRALTPLINHSRRTGHYLVQLRAGQVRARLTSEYRLVADEGVYGYDCKPGDAIQGQTIGVNAYAGKAHPPRRFSTPLDVDQALRNLHYRLISVTPKNPAPRPDEAVKQLRSLCEAEERGLDGLVEALHAMLNLFVIYAERSFGPGQSMAVLDSVLSLCPEMRPTKQTLHLLVRSILWPGELDYTGPTVLDTDRVAPRRRKTRVPSESPDVRVRLEHVLDRFQTEYQIVPGTETFRHMLTFASMTNDPILANVAFDGWWIADSAPSSFTPGEGDHARFVHRAKRYCKFRDVVRILASRGWVRIIREEKQSRKEQYVWCGPSERGVDDVIGWEGMSVEEREDVRRKREKWAARDRKKAGSEEEVSQRDAQAELVAWKIQRAREKRKKRPGVVVVAGHDQDWRGEEVVDANGDRLSELDGAPVWT